MDDLFNTAFHHQQRERLGCAPENGPLYAEEKSAPLLPDDLNLDNRIRDIDRKKIFFYDPGKETPRSSLNSIRDSYRRYAGDPQVSFHIIGCTDEAGPKDYNTKLANKRVDGITNVFRDMNVRLSRICKVPKLNCDGTYAVIEMYSSHLERE
ncbi:MAG: hypothetical protein KDI13_00100 [Alphaproteobacteria bacterium]|nr:hypothetical protein [Alphaproteobacteria bacterium]